MNIPVEIGHMILVQTYRAPTPAEPCQAVLPRPIVEWERASVTQLLQGGIVAEFEQDGTERFIPNGMYRKLPS